MSFIRNILLSVFFVDAKKQEKPSGKEPRWAAWMLFIGVAVILVLIGIANLQYWVVENCVKKNGTDDVTRFGISGDFFGFANALFSALAFAMIMVTLWMQKYELKLQRNEIDQTQEIMLEQTASLQRQTFENTFFGMLRLHTEIVDGVKIRGKAIHGREAIGVLYAELFRQLCSGTSAAGRRFPLSKANDSYHKWYSGNEAEIGHYFRTLYNLMRYINEYDAEVDQKTTYARLVRAQLSRNELQLLLFNGLSKFGEEKFKPLIEKYALLKHCERSGETAELREQYKDTAFGSETGGNAQEG